MTVTLYEEQDTFVTALGCVLLRLRNISGKICTETKTQVSCSINYFENCFIYETMLKNTEEPKRTQMTKK